MHVNNSRSTRRWVRRLASLAVATAGLATSAAAIGPATPASASGGVEQATEENPDGGPDFVVIPLAGVGNYDYIYDDGRVRQYRNWTFVGEFFLSDDDRDPR
jgi:hypothetical protein